MGLGRRNREEKRGYFRMSVGCDIRLRHPASGRHFFARAFTAGRLLTQSHDGWPACQ